MKTRILLFLSVLLLGASPAHAQLGDFLKKVIPPPQQQGGRKGNQTENLISSGIGLLKALQPIGYKEEMAIGGAVALEAVARFGGLWQNPEVEKYVATVGKAVAQTSDRPDIPYYFGILNSEEPNAFAVPGGYIFVSRGFLKLVKNEAQLAGVLGHEITHVAKKHALEAIRRSKMLGSISEVTLSALDKDPKMFDSIVKETVALVLDRGLDQAKELEADATGTDYAFRVGYNPAGLKNFLAILAQQTKGTAGHGVFKTHPDTSSRVMRLENVLKSSEYSGAAALPVLAERLTQHLTGASL